MKSKCVLYLCAILFFPLVLKAEWINNQYWPWIYCENNTWEYALTSRVWTCTIMTNEYSLWGNEAPVLAPTSLEGKRVIFFLPNLTHSLEINESPSLSWWNRQQWHWGPSPVVFSYEVREPDRANLLVQKPGDNPRVILLELEFLTPSGGEAKITDMYANWPGGILIRNSAFWLESYEID